MKTSRNKRAIVVSSVDGPEQEIEHELTQLGFARVQRAGSLAEALTSLDEQGADLLVVPIDVVDESQLATLDRLLRRDQQLAIIATGPAAEPELMLRAMRAGIQEFLVRPPAAGDVKAAVERVGRRLSGGTVSGEVYAVFGAKGGVGASTVAVNLAYALTQLNAEARVAVADLGVPGGDVRLLLDVRPAYDLGDIARKIDRMDADLLQSVMAPAQDGLWVLAAPERPEADEEIDAAVATSVLAQLRRAFEYAVIDCEHRLNDRTLAALDAADRILLLTELKVPALRAAQRTLAIFRRLGYANEKMNVVVNRFQSGDVITPAEAADVLKADIAFRLPNDYRSSSKASTDGVPVGMAFPESKLAQAYQQLAQQFSGLSIPAGSERPSQNGSRRSLRGIFSRKRS